ncbi:MAG: hypothetical protein QXW80_02820 [Candidatus Micrarchaeia archaeon]
MNEECCSEYRLVGFDYDTGEQIEEISNKFIERLYSIGNYLDGIEKELRTIRHVLIGFLILNGLAITLAIIRWFI